MKKIRHGAPEGQGRVEVVVLQGEIAMMTTENIQCDTDRIILCSDAATVSEASPNQNEHGI